jgi:putative GTP pyrophosphokinase
MSNRFLLLLNDFIVIFIILCIMNNFFTKSRIDQLGHELKQEKISPFDILFLYEYRKSFGEAYNFVIDNIRDYIKINPTGRPAKSTGSIIDKLKRETIRLSQIQDIAGCRIVVTDIDMQEKTVNSLQNLFSKSKIIDRRNNPSHGYRAVHIIPVIYDKPVEIQVRTKLQHLWAELSEKYSDIYDPSVKYGGGPFDVQEILKSATHLISECENIEKEIKNEKLKDPEKIHINKFRNELIDLFNDSIKNF